MPKITISSSRSYYHELSIDDLFSISHDIDIYQSMLHKAYREFYNDHIINLKYLKNILFKRKQLKKINKKIVHEEKLLKQYEMTKYTLICLSKT